MDGSSKLWDFSTGRLVRSYLGGNSSKSRVSTGFNCTEDLVLSSDGPNVIIWDARTGSVLHRLPGHSKTVRCVVASPTSFSFMSCSDDSRARFWTLESPDDLEQ